jgi:hypothetical protein
MSKDRGDKKYMEKDEKHDRKRDMDQMKSMKTAGIATAFKKAQKQMGKKNTLVKPKAQKKV